jgi:hypothetical protein
MFGKRLIPPVAAAPTAPFKSIKSKEMSFFDQPLQYERIVQSIKEDPQFFDKTVDPRALMKALDADPYLLQKEQASRLNGTIFELVKHRKGLTIDVLFGILGSLAGWVCLLEAFRMTKAGAREDTAVFSGMEGISFDGLKGSDGREYVFGNLIDNLLLKRETSIWKLTGNCAQRLGAVHMPDVAELWEHIKNSFQKPNYGVPRRPFDKAIGGNPIEIVREFWPKLGASFLTITQERMEIHQVFGFAIQAAMHQRPAELDPGYLAALVMECALPTAHVHPERFGIEAFCSSVRH